MRKLAFASPMVNQILIRSWWGWSRGVVEPLKLTLPLFFLMAFFFFTSLFEVERAGGAGRAASVVYGISNGTLKSIWNSQMLSHPLAVITLNHKPKKYMGLYISK